MRFHQHVRRIERHDLRRPIDEAVTRREAFRRRAAMLREVAVATRTWAAAPPAIKLAVVRDQHDSASIRFTATSGLSFELPFTYGTPLTVHSEKAAMRFLVRVAEDLRRAG